MRKWLWFKNSQRGIAQACCRCGRMIPGNRPRHWLHPDVSPLDTAVIKHPHCTDGKILYDGRGNRIEDIAILDFPPEQNPRERGDDDGVEYADPRDHRDERL